MQHRDRLVNASLLEPRIAYCDAFALQVSLGSAPGPKDLLPSTESQCIPCLGTLPLGHWNIPESPLSPAGLPSRRGWTPMLMTAPLGKLSSVIPCLSASPALSIWTTPNERLAFLIAYQSVSFFVPRNEVKLEVCG